MIGYIIINKYVYILAPRCKRPHKTLINNGLRKKYFTLTITLILANPTSNKIIASITLYY